jgi:hypothetical protein
MDRILSMILNRLIGQLINRGISAGINRAMGAPARPQTAEERAQSKVAKDAVRRGRQVASILRRLR